ncbi:MAG: hypothetical protein JKY03_15710 [Aureispira sp.]|nr:hypothetical protein [Aureispira sp.]
MIVIYQVNLAQFNVHVTSTSKAFVLNTQMKDQSRLLIKVPESVLIQKEIKEIRVRIDPISMFSCCGFLGCEGCDCTTNEGKEECCFVCAESLNKNINIQNNRIKGVLPKGDYELIIIPKDSKKGKIIVKLKILEAGKIIKGELQSQ